jgi:predicted AAA+ superfamily ATPase
MWVDLLDPRLFRQFSAAPETLGEMIRARRPSFVVIDEIQKVPSLLDEVHRFHEQGVRFGLCGSSARKVRRGHANLLGGRAIRFELFGLVSAELGNDFDLLRLLNRGYLPRIYDSARARRLLDAYVADYLKEEVVNEGLIRNVGPFDDFLRQAALSDTAPINMSTIARECGVSSQTVRAYFQILEDTLLGRFLPAFTRRPRRRVQKTPKFYFHDVGVVGRLTRRGVVEPGSELFGKAFENWVFHELVAYNSYHDRDAELSYWRLSSGAEVDFLVNGPQLAIECKATPRVRSDHLKGVREFRADQGGRGRSIIVSLIDGARKTDDGIEILGVKAFLDLLWGGQLF